MIMQIVYKYASRYSELICTPWSSVPLADSAQCVYGLQELEADAHTEASRCSFAFAPYQWHRKVHLDADRVQAVFVSSERAHASTQLDPPIHQAQANRDVGVAVHLRHIVRK
jgi:hypothetical protein